MGNNENLETIAMNLIVYSGDARSYAFRALKEAKKGNFEETEKLLKQSKESNVKAHQIQSELLAQEASGKEVKMSMLLAHAQDHLMVSVLAQELIEEIIEIHQNNKPKEE